jgi:hypothetical protein
MQPSIGGSEGIGMVGSQSSGSESIRCTPLLFMNFVSLCNFFIQVSAVIL